MSEGMWVWPWSKQPFLVTREMLDTGGVVHLPPQPLLINGVRIECSEISFDPNGAIDTTGFPVIPDDLPDVFIETRLVYPAPHDGAQ